MSTLYVDLISRPDGPKASNGRRRTRNAYPTSEGSAPLSNAQKARLCIMAQRAFAEIHGPATAGVTAASMEAWRRAEQKTAVGKSSLTTCTQADFNPLLAHFAEMAGETGVAVNAHIQDATAARRVAMHKLKTECAARSLTLAYPAAIARSKYKCALDDATPAQIWKLVFDVRTSKHKPTGKAPTSPGLPIPKSPRSAAPLGPLPAKLTFTKTGTKPPPIADEPF